MKLSTREEGEKEKEKEREKERERERERKEAAWTTNNEHRECTIG